MGLKCIQNLFQMPPVPCPSSAIPMAPLIRSSVLSFAEREGLVFLSALQKVGYMWCNLQGVPSSSPPQRKDTSYHPGGNQAVKGTLPSPQCL